MEAKGDPEDSRKKPRQWLCSHLVQLSRDDEPHAVDTGLLEDIDEEGAGLAVEAAYPKDGHLTIRAPGFQARVEVVDCSRRESDFYLETRFVAGFRWTPAHWRPDQLYRVPGAGRNAKGAAGEG